jgi:hypothetical protein
MDRIRARHGSTAITKGRGLNATTDRQSPPTRFGLGAASDHADEDFEN